MPFRVGLGVAAAVLALVILRVRFGYDVAVPPMPPRPQPSKLSTIDVERAVERSPQFYANHVAEDATAYKLERAPTAAEMGQALPYRVENPGKVLDPADRSKNLVEALGLRLSLSVQTIEG